MNFQIILGYEKLLKELQEAHPNWEFEILETGLDWSEVIIAESTGYHGKNVVPSTRADAWKCTCNKTVENVWKCASTAAVAYYMDPRNSLNENYIFQFEQLTYDEENQTKEGVELILEPCDYAQGKVTYYDSNGKKQTLNKTYVDVIMEAAKEYNISPYHLASRIRQEQGAGNAGSMISGTWTGGDGNYKGLYNFFNICAFGNNIILNGLKYAKQQGWTNPEKSIKGGAKILAAGYISIGQDTLYLEKFDVINGGDGYYSHQYMTNVSASKTEGYTIRNTYTNMGLLSSDSKIKFKIPVYKNMPEQICPEPGTEKTVTQDVEITENNVRVRKGKGTNYDIITTLDKGTKLLRIELDNSKTGGYYWDKVVLSDGTKGYIARDYLKQIDLQSNCNEKYITTKYTDFRNGPGTSKTTVLKVLPAGQIVTIVEKDKYKSIDGNDWCRIKLSDGTYGYVTANSFEEYDPTKVDQLKIICTDGLTIRSLPSTSSSALGTLYKGAVVTRIEKNVESSNTNYVWDKIITSSGITGYIATRDIKNNEDWAEIINSDNQTDTPTDTTIEIKGSGFKTSDTNIVCQPKITVANIKAVSEDIIIKKGDTIIENATSVGTGYTLTLKDKTYTIVVLGDVNGDNEINSADLLTIVKYLKGILKITQEYEIKSADVNKDGEINSADLLCIVKYLKGSIKIEV